MQNIAIIGSGSWGTALGIHLANLGNNIKIWSFDEEEAELMRNRKCKFLPNIELPEGIYCSTNIEEIIEDTDLILHVTPSKFTRDTVKLYKKFVTNQPIIICSKGFEKNTLYTLNEIIKEEMPNAKIGALSGPSHAEEVSIGIPTAMVVAAENNDLLEDIRNLFMCEKMRIYTSTDLTGVELGGALKNIIAFCAGVAYEIGMGDNTFAALVTRGLVEISNLGIKMGGKLETFYGLTGLGDLIVTCQSKHSRNRRAGILIGKGKTIEEAKKEIGMTIEAIDNIEVAYELSKKFDVEMPIVETAYEVLYKGLNPNEAVIKLMTRDKKSE
ncbi:MAG: NAD(P)-dependent glycerol-3-phosphate dehydrogenase [Clostridia bacterium]|nr:NAD(P)-dependent glycerol-3-phosphate dehydrogenase [Clostridia bacterium]